MGSIGYNHILTQFFRKECRLYTRYNSPCFRLGDEQKIPYHLSPITRKIHGISAFMAGRTARRGSWLCHAYHSLVPWVKDRSSDQNRPRGVPQFLETSISDYIWVVVFIIFSFHPEPWGNHPIWLIFFSNGLKPPIRYIGYEILSSCIGMLIFQKPQERSLEVWNQWNFMVTLKVSTKNISYGPKRLY